MHPKTATLIAFSDSEADKLRRRLIARHLQKCEKCRLELRRIQREKDDLSALAGQPAPDLKQGLAELLSAAAGWREAGDNTASPELKGRVRAQIETYFGSRAAALVEQPDLRADELLGKVLDLVAVLLGQDAAEAVVDDLLRGLNCAALTAEAQR
jgi:hypothetical protein